MRVARILRGDALETLRAGSARSVQCIITSPPYYRLRDYKCPGQIGMEKSPEEYIDALVVVFHEGKRVLKDDGVLWLNIGDTYAGSGRGWSKKPSLQLTSRAYSEYTEKTERPKNYDGQRIWRESGIKRKDLIGIPWMLAFALRADGWWLRSEVIWSKSNGMPDSAKDRPTRSHEQIFLLSKSRYYYYNADAIREPLKKKTHTTFGTFRRAVGGDKLVRSANWHSIERKPKLLDDGSLAGANKRSVWVVAAEKYHADHYATYPSKLIEPCVLAGSRPGDTILDPLSGTGTTGLVALRHDRDYIGIDLSEDYCEIARQRVVSEAPLFHRLVG